MPDYMDTDDSQQLLGWFEGTVLDSIWSSSRIESENKYTGDGADTTKLYWHVRVDDVLQDYDKIVAPTMTMSMGIGEKWHWDPDNKLIVRHEDDPGDEAVENGIAKPILFKGSSLYGKFLGLCTGKYESYYTQTPVDPLVDDLVILDDGPPIEYDMMGASVNLRERGVEADPRDSSIWTGMRWLFRGTGFVYRQTRGTPPFRATPVAWLGYDPDASDSAPGSPQGGASGGVVVEAAQVALALPEGTSDGVVGKVTELVNSASSHTEFMKNALKVSEVKGDPDIKAAVMNADSGPWAVKTLQAQES